MTRHEMPAFDGHNDVLSRLHAMHPDDPATAFIKDMTPRSILKRPGPEVLPEVSSPFMCHRWRLIPWRGMQR